MLALTAAGGAALAAVLAVRRHARRLGVVQHKTDLHTWESEGGSPARPAVVKPPPVAIDRRR